ncbi:hypothetical protein PF005_g25040 [Phytophthora fragariae]|uniref:Uncharacterized protein n=1 Tax=Phytophthora fragariae TaxID=53985 RepID=A0A6A3E3B1_9STRA|nr:hypothetical protein PF003_g33624 [Phytophthora fragariae]KAE8924298.1 hypothetical protein PF009_g25469 [Phytophthora fragariae]KAE9067550.1 hypothetical protein PF010_g27418 [Phytophthora fragariae]KAE9079778.1 hypothetical protein PF006_g27449 [Phytophthora fragariae]KAE9101859.1 hypothetical protein PF007_g14978 [Phytophthora fragariae]
MGYKGLEPWAGEQEASQPAIDHNASQLQLLKPSLTRINAPGYECQREDSIQQRPSPQEGRWLEQGQQGSTQAVRTKQNQSQPSRRHAQAQRSRRQPAGP